MDNIDFFTFISRNSADYAEYLKYTCEKFKSNEIKINYKYLESEGAERLPEGYEYTAKVKAVGHNSSNHGVTLNEALKHVKSDYAIFSDADIAILYPNWDLVVRKMLNKIACFGFGRPSFSEFPSVFFFCFRSDLLKNLKLDFRPSIRKGSDSPKKYKFNGKTIKCDTGWKVALAVKQAGYKSKTLECVLGKSKRSLLPFKSKAQKQFCLQKPEHMAEWHYNGKLFGTHKQASRNHPLNDSKWGRTWKERVELYYNG